MFNSLMPSSSSPCPSPVKELAATIKRVSSPRRQKYKAFVGSREPVISKGRLTMTGGFTDFRPPYYRDSSLESSGSSSSGSTPRSDSCDSSEAILATPQTGKQSRHFVKVPKNAFASAVGHLSPRLSKKVLRAVQSERAPEAAKHPVWPSVMTTYGRGVSTSPVQTIMMPLEPSLTAMKAQAILDERRDIRLALQMLAYKANLQQQVEASPTQSLYGKDEGSSDESSSDDDGNDEEESPEVSENHVINMKNGLFLDVLNPEPFLINPEISAVSSEPRVLTTPESLTDEDFQGESPFDALDLNSVPTLTPEELARRPVAEVRNVHLVCDYIVLETGPPTESVFV